MCWVSRTEGSASHFAELTLAECERLLAEHKAGRVGLNAPTGPQILPVTYAYYAKTIVFRTSPYGLLSSLGRHTRVAFEIDDIDEERESGWSVLVLGTGDAGVHADFAVEGRPRSLGRGHTQLVHHDHPRNDHWTDRWPASRGLSERVH